jgi:phosphoglycerate dehydrogenase-like enzyme
MNLLKGLFVLEPSAYKVVYAPSAAAAIAERVELVAPPQTRETIAKNIGLLRNVELLFSGWGAPLIDSAFLDAAPNLKAIFYAAGAIKGWATPSIWERNVLVTTANHANAIPVAEYTVATALFSLKEGWRLAFGGMPDRDFQVRTDVPGNYHTVIGLVGMGTIARIVVKMLAPFHMKILTYDPYLSVEEAGELGVTSVGLQTLFEEADVVSLHVPNLPPTRGMINAELLSRMKQGATFINTARGMVVNEEDLIKVLQERPDLQAVLDVTQQEPPPPSSPLHKLRNVILTPHIAGSNGRECQRMGQYMVDELDRYLSGSPLLWEVRASELAHSVHEL